MSFDLHYLFLMMNAFHDSRIKKSQILTTFPVSLIHDNKKKLKLCKLDEKQKEK